MFQAKASGLTRFGNDLALLEDATASLLVLAQRLLHSRPSSIPRLADVFCQVIVMAAGANAAATAAAASTGSLDSGT